MRHGTEKEMAEHVDVLIDEVVDDPHVNSFDRHFLHKVHGGDHMDRRQTRRVLNIYARVTRKRREDEREEKQFLRSISL
jgi:hypothetical protein